MPKNRITTPKKYTFGTCGFSRTSPHRDVISPNTKVLNVIVSFEDALKLNLAISECVRKLNSYNRNYREGKIAALNFTLHLNKNRITINQGKL